MNWNSASKSFLINKKCKGIILLELLITFVLSVLVLTFLYKIFIISLNISKESKNIIATHNFQYAMDYISNEARYAVAVYNLRDLVHNLDGEKIYLPFVLLLDNKADFLDNKSVGADRMKYVLYYQKDNCLYRGVCSRSQKTDSIFAAAFTGNNRLSENVISIEDSEYFEDINLLRLRFEFKVSKVNNKNLLFSKDIFLRNIRE